MENKNYIELIERYTLGQMSQEERMSFESKLSSDKALKKFYDLYHVSLDAIETDIEKDLRNDLKSWEQESVTQETKTSTSETKVVPMRRRMMSWAAASSFLLLAGFFGMNYLGTSGGTINPNDQFYTDYYKAPALSTFRDSNPTNKDWQANLDQLINGNNEKALAYFNSIEAGNENYLEAQYLAGHTNMRLERYDAALKNFKEGMKGETSRYTDKSQWNYLLANLKKEKLEVDFMPLLQKIASTNHSFTSEAKELLTKIESR